MLWRQHTSGPLSLGVRLQLPHRQPKPARVHLQQPWTRRLLLLKTLP